MANTDYNSKITFKVSQEQRDGIFAAAKEQNLNVSQLLREIIFNSELPETRTVGFDPSGIEAYQKLQPLQSNLNQLAHNLNLAARQGTLNQKINPEVVKVLSKSITYCYTLLQQVRQEMRGQA